MTAGAPAAAQPRAGGACERFLAAMQAEVAAHPAVRHAFLERFRRGGLSRDQIAAFGLQHYQLVRVFTTHLANLIARSPAWAQDLAGVLSDEYGRETLFRSHAHLYRDFLRSLGLRDEDWGRAAQPAAALPGRRAALMEGCGGLRPETRDFIEGHLRLTREGELLEALGALGPGHEMSIPLMFDALAAGIRASPAAGTPDIEYFTLHISEDPGHAAAFNGIIARCASGGDLGRIRQGALRSLDLRRRFWDGCESAVFAG